MQHRGFENGNLIATYNQLEKFGIGRQYINLTIQEAVMLGLIVYTPGARKSPTESYCNQFRLTYLKFKLSSISPNELGYAAPTNKWQKVTKDRIVKIKEALHKLKNKKRCNKSKL